MAFCTIAFILYRLRPGIMESGVIIMFGWQFEEAYFAYTLFLARYFQGYDGLGAIWGYVVGGPLMIIAVLSAVFLYYFWGKLKMSPFWVAVIGVYAFWALAGTPVSLPVGLGPWHDSFWVSFIEEWTIVAYCFAYYDTFRYVK